MIVNFYVIRQIYVQFNWYFAFGVSTEIHLKIVKATQLLQNVCTISWNFKAYLKTVISLDEILIVLLFSNVQICSSFVKTSSSEGQKG